MIDTSGTARSASVSFPKMSTAEPSAAQISTGDCYSGSVQSFAELKNLYANSLRTIHVTDHPGGWSGFNQPLDPGPSHAEVMAAYKSLPPGLKLEGLEALRMSECPEDFMAGLKSSTRYLVASEDVGTKAPWADLLA